MFLNKLTSYIKERFSKKYKLDYKEDSVIRDYSYVKVVPWNRNREDFRKEFESLKPLIVAIKENVRIYDIDSMLQRRLCINEMLDVFESDTHYKKFTTTELESLGEKYPKWTLSCDVYINKEKGIVYKSKNIFYHDRDKKHNPMDTIFEYLLHNILFPNVPYHLEGTGTREGKPTLVFSQPYIGGVGIALEGERRKYMTMLGLELKNYADYGNEYFTLDSIHLGTVFSDRGNLYFIDPRISFIRPPREVFDYVLGLTEHI